MLVDSKRLICNAEGRFVCTYRYKYTPVDKTEDKAPTALSSYKCSYSYSIILSTAVIATV